MRELETESQGLPYWLCLGTLRFDRSESLSDVIETQKKRIEELELHGNATRTENRGVDIDKKKALIGGKQRNRKGKHLTLYTIYSTYLRTLAFLAIGIPTVFTHNEYIWTTLDSLLAQMSDQDRADVIIIVFLADFDAHRRSETSRRARHDYALHLQSGLIQIVEAPKSFYPPLDDLKTNFGDAKERVRWRAKQCLDYSFLIAYSHGLANYYLQLEDDVIASADFISAIREFVAMQTKPWIALDFSELGFIGKLYRDQDLKRLAEFLKFFYEEQPVDYLYRYFNAILTQKKPISRTPSLFQHIGTKSSLAGKVQQRVDRHFSDASRMYDSDNPPASVTTSIDEFARYLAALAYGKAAGFFWGRPPVEGDTFRVSFQSKVVLRRVVVETGNREHPADVLRYGRLEVDVAAACRRFRSVGEFRGGRVDVTWDKADQKEAVKCVRIYVTGAQDTWLLIREIAVWIK